MKKLFKEFTNAAAAAKFATKSSESKDASPKTYDGLVLKVTGVEYTQFTHEGERRQDKDGRWMTIRSLEDWIASGNSEEHWSEEGLCLQVSTGSDKWVLPLRDVINSHKEVKDYLGRPWSPFRSLLPALEQSERLRWTSLEFLQWVVDFFTTHDLRCRKVVAPTQTDTNTGKMEAVWTCTRRDKTPYKVVSFTAWEPIQGCKHQVTSTTLDLCKKRFEYDCLLAIEETALTQEQKDRIKVLEADEALMASYQEEFGL